MPLYLRERNPHLEERMDDDTCDRAELFNTYRQFGAVNTLLSQWHTIYQQYIKPYALANNNSCSILDIGFGGGDIPLKLNNWCQQDGIQPAITAIETDHRALEFVRQHEYPPSINFVHASSTDILKQDKLYDFVISNHLIHHLKGDAFLKFLEEARTLCSHRVLFNDIERSDIGYLLFNLLSRPFFHHSFITEDGLISIKRSYTKQELKQKVPKCWTVKRLFPYRLLLTYVNE